MALRTDSVNSVIVSGRRSVSRPTSSHISSTVRRVMDLLRRTHDVICVDTGNNVESVNWQTVMRQADQLVITTVPREDAAFTADWMLDLLDELPGLLRQLGICVVVPPGLEADDVLGSAAALARRRGVAAALATGDQDAFALVAPTVQVFYLVTGGRMEQVSPSWLRARYGVGPAAYPAFAALRGDASDCLPGVKGIGAVTAARLLGAYGTVEEALDDPAGVARLLGGWVAEALVTQRATYELNRELMAIRDDVALDVATCTRRLDGGRVASVLEELGAADLTGRFLGAFTQLGRAAWRRAAEA